MSAGPSRLSLALVAGLAAIPAYARPVLPVEAKGLPVVLVVDTGIGQKLYARSADLRFAPASLAKTMTAYTAFQMISRGELRPGQRFVVTPAIAAAWRGRGSSMNLAAGDRPSLSDLLDGLMTVSANDGAVVLAQGAAGSVPNWTDRMGREAKALGLECSSFASPNGWPDGGSSYTCATDLARIGTAMVDGHPALYRRYIGQRAFSWNGRTQQNRDPALGHVLGADGIKTGHTREAGYGYLGSAVRDGRRLIVVIGGAQSEAQRAAAARALLEWGFSAWRPQKLFGAGTLIGSARVQGGAREEVGLIADRPVSVSIPADTQAPVRLRIAYRGPISAPIAKGARIATLEIAISGEPLLRVPLSAAETVKAAGPLERLRNGLKALFL